MNAELLSDGPNRGKLFYFDPHTKKYTGMLKTLKGWCGGSHNVCAAINLDFFHTQSGRPCFSIPHSPYYDMRERFIINMLAFDMLFDVDKRQGRTFVIDRGIFGLAMLRYFKIDFIITWEKGYSRDGWRNDGITITFKRSRTRNNDKDLRHISFECQESPWSRDASFRRIVVRARRGEEEMVEVSVITSNPTMDVQDVVWAIFCRWLQENDFKYLITYFGLNQMTSRGSYEIKDVADDLIDRMVDSPDLRKIKASLNIIESKQGKLLVRSSGIEKELQRLEFRKLRTKFIHDGMQAEKLAARAQPDTKSDSRGTKKNNADVANMSEIIRGICVRIQGKKTAMNNLQTDITANTLEIEMYESQLCDAVRKESRLKILADGGYRLLDTRRKGFMDALRVTASNIFRNVHEQFRAIYGNHREDHTFLRTLSRCAGSVVGTPTDVTITLLLPSSYQPHQIKAFEKLLRNLEEQINSGAKDVRQVRIRLSSGPRNLTTF